MFSFLPKKQKHHMLHGKCYNAGVLQSAPLVCYLITSLLIGGSFGNLQVSRGVSLKKWLCDEAALLSVNVFLLLLLSVVNYKGFYDFKPFYSLPNAVRSTGVPVSWGETRHLAAPGRTTWGHVWVASVCICRPEKYADLNLSGRLP